MKKFAIIALIAAGLIGGGVALAQVIPVPLLTTITATDLFQDIPQGVPGTGSVYVTASKLAGFVNSANYGAAPALTSCGTGSPAVTGNDIAGTITMGTSATGCVLTFAVARNSAPNCLVTWEATPLASQSYAVSTTALTLTQTSTSGNKAAYYCPLNVGN